MGEQAACAPCAGSACGARTGARGTTGRSPALLTLPLLVAWLGLATCDATAASAHPAALGPPPQQGAAGKAGFVGPMGGGGGLLPLVAHANADACARPPRGAQRHHRRRRAAALAMCADAEARPGESAAGEAPGAAMQFSLLDSGNFKRLEQFGPLRVQV